VQRAVRNGLQDGFAVLGRLPPEQGRRAMTDGYFIVIFFSPALLFASGCQTGSLAIPSSLKANLGDFNCCCLSCDSVCQTHCHYKPRDQFFLERLPRGDSDSLTSYAEPKFGLKWSTACEG
jgi:hypothetical protein